MSTTKYAIVWSKNNCSYCDIAKSMLVSNGFTIEERNIDGGTWTKKQLLEDIPTARTVPQIIIDDLIINGTTELRKYFD